MKQVLALLALLSFVGCPSQSPPGAAAGRAGGDSSTGHDHSDLCWLHPEVTNQDSQVDMMLFVVGLNHSFGGDGPNAAGVEELADAIKSAWPEHGEQIVIMSSSFYPTCPPTNGECLRAALEKRYGGHHFDLRDVPGDLADAHYGTRGVISGGRWEIKGSESLSPTPTTTEQIAKILLRDSVTGSYVRTYSMHTPDRDDSLLYLKPTMLREKATFFRGALAPIFAGDFNFRASDKDAQTVTGLFRAEFTWINDSVHCPEDSRPPGNVFNLEEGDKMHAIVGKISAHEEYSYPCATGTLDPVRLSFSADSQGRLAVRPADGFSAQTNGIVLNGTVHNVLAFGMKINSRSDPLPPACTACNDDPCGPNPCHAEDCPAQTCKAPTPYPCNGICVKSRSECGR